ncbi:MAG: acyltransferase [Nitrospirae bacterium]|nr:acyltransferase [Nitrospirota bacterium]
MRGLAALMVAIGHTVIVLQIDGVTNLWTTAFLDLPGLQAVIAKTVLFPANGTAAVSLFFVLSGLVLTLSLNRTTGRWPSVAWWFFIRRIIRLYPPWLVSLAVVGATIPLVLQFGPSPQDSSWFRSHYQEAWTLETWARNLALASVTLNSVGWTLQVEFFAALLIVCWWGIRRAVPSALTDVTLLLAIAWVSSHWNGGPLIGVFALSFYLGSLIPQIGWVVGTLYRCHPVLPSLTLVPGWIMLVTAAHLASTVPCRVLYEAVGAAWCLTVVFESPLPSVRAILLARPIHLLGKVSFSFYLLHFPILYVFGRVTLHWLPTQILVNWPLLVDLTLGCVSIVFAAGLALVMFYAVERPGLNLGKQFGIRMGALPLDRANIPWISRPGIPSVMDGSASS